MGARVRSVPVKKRLAKRPKGLFDAGISCPPLGGGAQEKKASGSVRVSPGLEENLTYFAGIFGQNVDFVIRKFEIGVKPEKKPPLFTCPAWPVKRELERVF